MGRSYFGPLGNAFWGAFFFMIFMFGPHVLLG
jgi:hypothetical protein